MLHNAGENNMKIAVIDGQGGGIGRAVVDRLRIPWEKMFIL